MAPPPPSQAGKFKPRKKTTKKIRVGEVVTPGAAVPSSQIPAAAAAAPVAPNVRGPAGGRGGRGAGRGTGRGGRGRGRAPAPQGQVFFTGAPAPAKRSAGGGSSSASRATRSSGEGGGRGGSSGTRTSPMNVKEDVSVKEEIVATVEDGVGAQGNTAAAAAAAKRAKADRILSLPEEPAASQLSFRTAKKGSGEDVYYDSDSSAEEVRSRSKVSRTMQPLTLPFPSSQEVDQRASGATEEKAFLEDDQNWFLVQLPTRLPPVKQSVVPNPIPSAEGTAKEVVTPHTQTDCFDHSLNSAPAGRMGKIRVHKSGKTVLVLEDADGNPTVQLNVTEGLPCAFRQLAVSIDENAGEFVPLGDVRKTLVATPDLSRSFGTS